MPIPALAKLLQSLGDEPEAPKRFRINEKAVPATSVLSSSSSATEASKNKLMSPEELQRLADGSAPGDCGKMAWAELQESLKEAFEIFINREIGKFSFAALMASFRDGIPKKSGERLSDDEVEVLLPQMAEFSPRLSDRDFFAEIYRNQLSKRVLYETSASEEAKKSMIAKLKRKCGAQ